MSLYLSHKTTNFQVGDTIKVHQKIVDGEKTRIQVFEGLVIKVKGHQHEKTFTVRKVTGGYGVERIFPVDTPFIKKIEIVSKGKPTRAKLYYLRNRIGRLALKVKTDYQANIKEQSQKNAQKAAKQASKSEAESAQPEAQTPDHSTQSPEENTGK